MSKRLNSQHPVPGGGTQLPQPEDVAGILKGALNGVPSGVFVRENWETRPVVAWDETMERRVAPLLCELCGTGICDEADTTKCPTLREVLEAICQAIGGRRVLAKPIKGRVEYWSIGTVVAIDTPETWTHEIDLMGEGNIGPANQPVDVLIVEREEGQE